MADQQYECTQCYRDLAPDEFGHKANGEPYAHCRLCRNNTKADLIMQYEADKEEIQNLKNFEGMRLRVISGQREQISELKSKYSGSEAKRKAYFDEVVSLRRKVAEIEYGLNKVVSKLQRENEQLNQEMAVRGGHIAIWAKKVRDLEFKLVAHNPAQLSKAAKKNVRKQYVKQLEQQRMDKAPPPYIDEPMDENKS